MCNWFVKSLSFNLKYPFYKTGSMLYMFLFSKSLGVTAEQSNTLYSKLKIKCILSVSVRPFNVPFHSICCVSPSRTPMGDESVPFFIGSSEQHVSVVSLIVKSTVLPN